MRFNLLCTELASLSTRLTPLTSPAGLYPEEAVAYINPPLIAHHMTFHGTTILLYNIVLVLEEKGAIGSFGGVGSEEARRKVLESCEALLTVIALIRSNGHIASLQVEVVLFVSLLSAILETKYFLMGCFLTSHL